MIFILFGIPGVGKNYVGRILSEQYGFHFYDADLDLTPDMRECIRLGQLYTDEMRDRFFEIVVHKIQQLQSKHSNIVVAQALAKERNREQILGHFPESQFFWIQAQRDLIYQRLVKRSDWVSIEYADKISYAFDLPLLQHEQINNNEGCSHIIRQFAPFCIQEPV